MLTINALVSAAIMPIALYLVFSGFHINYFTVFYLQHLASKKELGKLKFVFIRHGIAFCPFPLFKILHWYFLHYWGYRDYYYETLIVMTKYSQYFKKAMTSMINKMLMPWNKLVRQISGPINNPATVNCHLKSFVWRITRISCRR